MKNRNISAKMVDGIIWKFLERICAQSVTLVVSIIIARILTPEDYGIVGLVSIFFSFANVIISGGLNTALIQKKDADEKDYNTVLSVSVAVSLILYALLFFLAPLIAEWYNNNLLIIIVRVMGISLPIYAVKSIVCAYISFYLQFRKFFFATLGGTLISAFVGISMAYAGYGPWALVCQQISNTLVDTVILLCSTKIRLRFAVYFDRLQGLFKYGGNILLSSVVNVAYSKINPLFIGLKYSSSDLSYYTKGEMYPSAFSSAITNTVSSVLFPFLSKYQDNKDKLLDYTRQFIRLTSYLVFPLMLGLFAVSDLFVEVFLTHKWIDASFYIRIFCIDSMFGIIAVGNCETIKAMGRSDIYLKVEIIKKFCYFVIIGFFIVFSHTPRQLSISMILCTIVQVIVNSYPNTKLISYRIFALLSDILPNLLISTIMCISVMLIGKIPSSFIVVFLIQIMSGFIIYLILSIITKNRSFFFIVSYIKYRFLEKGDRENDI